MRSQLTDEEQLYAKIHNASEDIQKKDYDIFGRLSQENSSFEPIHFYV